jgi:low temperature requirement protein LtrA
MSFSHHPPPHWHVQMRGRDRREAHRAATPLELFFDLSFVVAVAAAAASMHHELAAGHILDGVAAYAMVFFAIWWAWMNFTWFASAFDCDDVLYRLLTFVQMAGALIIAAGVTSAFEERDFTVMTIGYLVMRVGLVTQWLRVAVEDAELRETALRYALALTVVQALWVARLALPPEIGLVAFIPLALLDLGVPVWAELDHPRTPWHPGHIAERYGLFTIIVLGESVLAATVAVRDAVGERGLSVALVTLSFGAVVLLFAMWWAYFKHHADEEDLQHSPWLWGYGQYFVFASAAAAGAGIQVVAEALTHDIAIGAVGAALTVAVPVSIYLGAGWLVTNSGRSWPVFAPVALAIVLVLASALLAWLSLAAATLAIAGIVAAAVAVTAYRAARRVSPGFAEGSPTSAHPS